MPPAAHADGQDDLYLEGMHILPSFWGVLRYDTLPRLKILRVAMPDAAADGLQAALMDLCHGRTMPLEVIAQERCGALVYAAFDAARAAVTATMPNAHVTLAPCVHG